MLKYIIGEKLPGRILVILALMLFLTSCSSKKINDLRLKGIEELQKAKYEDAIESFNEAMELSDGKVGELQLDIMTYRAEAEYMTGDYEAAQKTIDTLREVDGDKENYRKIQSQLDAKKLITEATEALNNGDCDTARQKLDEASALGIKNDRELRFDEIVYLEKTAQWEAAYNAVKEYLEQYPSDKEAKRELKFLETRVDALESNEALSNLQ
ncbi:tetratricopeptide repeat protein [Oribacterium sp. WCC10]|uniref:tetratricopeptide repeat protein n=1 Tax=Oribacterium sp. WCC10 TaxID=1855343 RepID=UPI000B8504B8|nr:tetratricopeptide repeat protein [Oribacterium sp. WCC10]